MRQLQVCLATVVVIAACGGGNDHGAPAGPPSAECRAAAETLAAFELSDYAPVDDREPVIASIAAECARANLSAADATCLARATTRHAALRCSRVLTPDLVQITRGAGPGPCRPVMIAMELASAERLAQAPPEFLAEATAMFDMVRDVIGRSCRTGDWPAEVFACFDEADIERGAECLEKVPLEIQQKLQVEVNARARDLVAKHRRLRGGGDEPAALDPGVDPTGNASCDSYLAARAAFEQCTVAPASARAVVLATLDPLERPWRRLPAGTLAGVPAISPLCTAAQDQLRELASALGCVD